MPFATSSARRESRAGTLVAALEDALLAAYKKTPGASRHATVELDDEGDFRVFADRAPGGPRGAAARRGARARARRARAARGGDGREESHAPLGRRPRDRLVRGPRGRDQARGRDAGELRPHRRADREAGHPPADPRGRARDDVRRVHRPRRRGRDRHRPAGRRPQQRPRRSRQGRGAAARAPSRSTASATSRARASRPSSPRCAPARRARR